MFYVKEIFKSLQGEGYHSGRKAVFVRFTGCNLWNGKTTEKSKSICSFCDTDFVGTDGQQGGIYTQDNLIKKIKLIWGSQDLDKRFLVFTGGEPTLQLTHNLVSSLRKQGFFVALETNGTIDKKIKYDWVCVSPKSMKNWILKKGDEVKVIFPQNSLDLNEIKKMEFDFFFLQPMDGEKRQVNIWNTINYCKSHKPWFPSFQIHKTLNIY
tara:strand:- start:250 stop:879 length:630 start_codon:yes stop_codon:yes gene_type:complete